MSTQTFSFEQLVGKNLQGYTIHRLLDFDALHVVYSAQQGAQHPVLVKVFLLPADLSAEALLRFRQRFLETAARLAPFDHPHIVPLYAYGDELGYPYLVVPFVDDTTSPLAQLLQQQGPFVPEYALEIFQQIAAALDYARLQGMAHGSLEAAHILLDRERNVLLTKFGLQPILSLQGIEENERPYAHLFSLAGTFLGSPAYMAPEVVEGKMPDERSDVYALGVLLYELLSGSLPFTGEDPMAIAFEHVEQTVPPLRTLSPALAEAVDLVIQQALEYDPARRYRTAGKLVAALELAIQHSAQADLAPAHARLSLSLPSVPAMPAAESQRRGLLSGMESKIMPATVEKREGAGQKRGLLSNSSVWQAVSPPASPTPRSVMPALPAADPASGPSIDESGNWQLRPPIMTGHLAIPEKKPLDRAASVPGFYPPLPSTLPSEQHAELVTPPSPNQSMLAPENEASGLGGIIERTKQLVAQELADPLFALSATSMLASEQSSSLTTPDAYMPMLPDLPDTPPPVILDKRRRRTLAVLAAGGVMTLGLLGLGGVSLNRIVQNIQKTPKNNASPSSSGTIPIASQQRHTIGKKSQPLNSAVKFTDLANKASLLIHLPGGQFVAYESACTHQGVTVVYDPKSHLLVCPRHQSVFNPAANGKVLSGPATVPLKAVKLQINADGSISL
jgi:serine/threonine protein kinase